MKNTGWLNFEGYDLHATHTTWWGWIWPVQHYRFTLDEGINGMAWFNGEEFIRPNQKEDDTDLGSIPPPLRSLFPATEFPRSYDCHDSVYKHGGLWYAPTLGGPWTFHRMTRDEADKVTLIQMARDEGVEMGESQSRVDRRTSLIRRAVSMFGGSVWDKYRKAEKKA